MRHLRGVNAIAATIRIIPRNIMWTSNKEIRLQ